MPNIRWTYIDISDYQRGMEGVVYKEKLNILGTHLRVHMRRGKPGSSDGSRVLSPSSRTGSSVHPRLTTTRYRRSSIYSTQLDKLHIITVITLVIYQCYS